jgi:hypothetical protein
MLVLLPFTPVPWIPLPSCHSCSLGAPFFLLVDVLTMGFERIPIAIDLNERYQHECLHYVPVLRHQFRHGAGGFRSIPTFSL